MFQIRLTQEARDQYDHLKKDKGLLKRHKAVQKALPPIVYSGIMARTKSKLQLSQLHLIL